MIELFLFLCALSRTPQNEHISTTITSLLFCIYFFFFFYLSLYSHDFKNNKIMELLQYSHKNVMYYTDQAQIRSTYTFPPFNCTFTYTHKITKAPLWNKTFNKKRRIENGGKKHTVPDPTSSTVNILRLLDRSFSGLGQQFWHSRQVSHSQSHQLSMQSQCFRLHIRQMLICSA